jgi:hypothetical protein
VQILFKNKENYDAIAKNIDNIEKCADIASSIYGVGAFGYNYDSQNCYVAKTSISMPVINTHPYHNFYKDSDRVCNKTLFMLNQNAIAADTMIGNRLYKCYNNKANQDHDYDYFYFEKNKPEKLITYQDPDRLPITYHNFFDIDWPKNKSEMNDLDVRFGDNMSTRDFYGDKIITGPTDNIDISWKPNMSD